MCACVRCRAVKALCGLSTAQPDNSELCRVCVRILRNMSFTVSLRGKLVELGACRTLIAFTGSPLDEVRDDCVVALCNLVRDEGSIGTMILEGTVAALASASKFASVSADGQRSCVFEKS